MNKLLATVLFLLAHLGVGCATFSEPSGPALEQQRLAERTAEKARVAKTEDERFERWLASPDGQREIKRYRREIAEGRTAPCSDVFLNPNSKTYYIFRHLCTALREAQASNQEK